MSLLSIFQKAEGIATIYGAPLYELIEPLGDAMPNDYIFDEDEGVISLTLEDKTMYVPVRRQTLEQGIEVDQIFTIGKFRATREERGDYNGEEWVVEKGNVKLFAY